MPNGSQCQPETRDSAQQTPNGKRIQFCDRCARIHLRGVDRGYNFDVALCPYCSVAADDDWANNEFAIAVAPLESFRPGHVVVAPRRHVARFYELDVEEQHYLWELVSEVRQRLLTTLHVDAVDIGFADAADEHGHTVVHVVPRSVAPSPLPAPIEWISG
jgi:diadenosine tetraphosphate (Ap4A) HIT family hydrolase